MSAFRNRRGPLVWLPFGLVALANPVSAFAQQADPWPIKEFQVVAVEPAGEVEDNRRIDNWVEEMVRIIRTETDYDPDFPPIWNKPTVSFPNIEKTKDEIEAVLREAALKLESWGFPPPALEPVVKNEAGVDAYRVYLVTGRPHSGAYHAKPCHFGIREAVLVLNAVHVLGSGGSLKDFGVQTAVHELVHASQGNLPSYSCGDGTPGQWVGEGTASAIGYDVLRQLRGTSSFRGMYAAAWGARMYSEQLPIPGATGTTRAYRSLSFWRYLAEYTRSRPTFPGPDATWSADYSYLPRLLGRDFSPRDCDAAGDSCDAELRWIDAGLREGFGLPLRELYARFMQVYAQYGQERAHSTEGGSPATVRKNWLGQSFAHDDGLGCAAVVLRPQPLEERQKEFVVSRFADVAARCWEIDLDGFSDAVPVAVTVSYRSGSEALLEQLTAVMADDSRRVDAAVVQTTADVPRATWYYDHEALLDAPVFLLTNVADSPDATRALANLAVTFTALEPFATIISSTPGPSGADVDQPIGIRFERGLEALVMDIIPESYPGIPTGLEQPCGLSTSPNGMRNGDPVTGEMLVFGMWHEGPIRPGEYAVHPHPEPETAPPVGTAGVTFALGLGNPMTGTPSQSFYGTGGVLRIESVSGGFVRGDLQVIGESILAVDSRHYGWDLGPCSAINPEPCISEHYVPNAAIRVEFGLPARSFSFPNRDAVAACLSPSKPNPGKANSGPGSDSGGDPDPKPDPDPGAEAGDDPGDGLPVGADPDAQAEPGEPTGDPVPVDRGGDAALGIGPSLILDFLEEEQADLSSEPQHVSGSATADRIAVQADGFAFRMALDRAEVDRCHLSQGAEDLFLMLGSGRLLRGDLHLDAGTGRLEFRAKFDEGDIVVRSAGPGSLRLTASEPAVRGDVSGGNLAIERDEGNESCDGIVDFSFRLTEAP